MTQILKKGEIEKHIWGHRLYDEQTGIMTLLEFLCVFASLPFEKQNPERSFDESTRRLQDYQIPKRTLLRSLIFNNPYIDEIYTTVQDPWIAWRDQFVADEQNKAIDQSNLLSKLSDLKRIKAMFEDRSDPSPRKSFENFSKVVRLIRFSGINLMSGKRWTSRFIFPWGQHCLYIDMNPLGRTDRRFFARNGEVMYLLLSFADRRGELAKLLNEKILHADNELDALCEALSFGDENSYCVPGKDCVLPADFFEYSKRRINILCDDLIRIFSLPIPASDIVGYASKVITLNLLCYYLEQGNAVLDRCGGDASSPQLRRHVMLCEVIKKQTSDIRRISKVLFERNDKRDRDAVTAYYEATAKALHLDDVAAQEDETDDDDFFSEESDESPDTLPQILKNHDDHWGNIHRLFARDCGLASKICTNAYRYAPSDGLLETLALVLVPKKRLLLSEFLAQAFDRYGLVFGEVEFRRSSISSPELTPNTSELKSNRVRLQNRLNALGLLVSLSDGFEFVLNPYQA